MCDDDNPSVLGSSAASLEPQALNAHQRKLKHHHQHQWSFSTPSPPLTDPLIAKSNGKPTAASPTQKARASADSHSSASSSVVLTNTGTANTNSLQWSRNGSAPNLADVPCRIHATPIAGCRNCRWEASLSSSAPAALHTATRRRCAVAISKGGSKQQATGRSSPPQGGSRAVLPNQGGLNKGVHGGGGGGGGKNNVLDVDDGTYHGPGKRVWEKMGGAGSSGGSSDLVSPGSGSTSPTSFYFPSAAAAAAAASSASATTPGGNNGSGTPSRPNARRKISTDPLPTFINDDGSGNTGAGGGGMARWDPMPSSMGAGGTRYGGNSGGGTRRRNPSPPVNRDPESVGTKRNAFAGLGSARSLPTLGEGPSNNGDGGGSEIPGRPRSADDMEKLVVSVATRGMQQALTFGLRNTFAMLLRKKVGTHRTGITARAWRLCSAALQSLQTYCEDYADFVPP